MLIMLDAFDLVAQYLFISSYTMVLPSHGLARNNFALLSTLLVQKSLLYFVVPLKQSYYVNSFSLSVFLLLVLHRHLKTTQEPSTSSARTASPIPSAIMPSKSLGSTNTSPTTTSNAITQKLH
jgi:hypothetical protein